MADSKRPKSQGQKHSDLFLTDPAALAPLMPYIKPEWRIWEPACGNEDSHPLVEALSDKYNRRVFGTDKRVGEGFDYLHGTMDEQWDCSITNPPYSLKDEWLERSYALGKPFALLLPYTAMEGRRRQALFKKYGIDILYLSRRVVFTTPNGTVGGSWFPTAWFTWKILPERIVFE